MNRYVSNPLPTPLAATSSLRLMRMCSAFRGMVLPAARGVVRPFPRGWLMRLVGWVATNASPAHLLQRSGVDDASPELRPRVRRNGNRPVRAPLPARRWSPLHGLALDDACRLAAARWAGLRQSSPDDSRAPSAGIVPERSGPRLRRLTAARSGRATGSS